MTSLVRPENDSLTARAELAAGDRNPASPTAATSPASCPSLAYLGLSGFQDVHEIVRGVWKVATYFALGHTAENGVLGFFGRLDALKIGRINVLADGITHELPQLPGRDRVGLDRIALETLGVRVVLALRGARGQIPVHNLPLGDSQAREVDFSVGR